MAQIDRLKVRLDGEDYTDDLLNELLISAQNIIFARRYPCAVWPDAVETKYEDLQVRIAVELFSRIGSEGQTAHGENGFSRTWDGANVSPALLSEITPKVGVVAR